MEQNNYKEVYDQGDEILLKHVLLFLFNSKWIILSITSLITTISIIYVTSITPIYEAVISVYPPSDLSVSKVNSARFKHKGILPSSEEDYLKEDISKIILQKLFSNPFREDVFKSNNYFKKMNLNEENGKFSVFGFVEGVREGESKNNKESLTSLALKGEDPLIISNFLNDLLRAAASDTLIDIKAIEQDKIDSRLDFIETELHREKKNIKETRLRKIKLLQEELKISVSLKNKEFNFSQINRVADNNSLRAHPEHNKALPIWYMYGEQALRQELDKLTSDKTFHSSLIDSLESQKAILTSVEFSFDDIELVEGVQSEVPITLISPKKRLIVSVMFFISLIISIFIAYLVRVIREK